MHPPLRFITALRVGVWVAGIGLALTVLTGLLAYNDPCTTANRGLPLPFYSDNCGCMDTIGPEWHLRNAAADWAVFSGLSLVFVPLIRRALSHSSRS